MNNQYEYDVNGTKAHLFIVGDHLLVEREYASNERWINASCNGLEEKNLIRNDTNKARPRNSLQRPSQTAFLNLHCCLTSLELVVDIEP